MTQLWSANQIVASNGAYGGKTVTFIHPTETNTLVTGVLHRAGSSSETPGNVLILIRKIDADSPNGDSDWYSIPGDAEVEVAA